MYDDTGDRVQIVNPNGNKGVVSATSTAARLARDGLQGYSLPPSAEDAPEGAPLVERPADTARVGLWREWAIANGVPADEAGTLSRDELVARFPIVEV